MPHKVWWFPYCCYYKIFRISFGHRNFRLSFVCHSVQTSIRVLLSARQKDGFAPPIVGPTCQSPSNFIFFLLPSSSRLLPVPALRDRRSSVPAPLGWVPDGQRSNGATLGGAPTPGLGGRRLWGRSPYLNLAYLDLSRLIYSHITLFILPAEHYSSNQPNKLHDRRGRELVARRPILSRDILHHRLICAGLDLPLVTGRFTAVTGLTGLDRLRYRPVTDR
jgi:hypothetical protein